MTMTIAAERLAGIRRRHGVSGEDVLAVALGEYEGEPLTRQLVEDELLVLRAEEELGGLLAAKGRPPGSWDLEEYRGALVRASAQLETARPPRVDAHPLAGLSPVEIDAALDARARTILAGSGEGGYDAYREALEQASKELGVPGGSR